jgi:hypothetical protein
MPTDCTPNFFEFEAVEGRKVVAAVVFPQIVERGSESWNGPSNRGLLSPKL